MNINNQGTLVPIIPVHRLRLQLPLYSSGISASFPSPADDFVDMMNRKKLRYKVDQPPQLKDYPVELTEKELSLGLEGVWDASMKPLLEILGDPKSMEWPLAELAKCDQYSYVEYLEKMGYSDTYVQPSGG